MTSKLSGKVVSVTGGSAALASASPSVRRGRRHVFITGRRESELDKAVTAIGATQRRSERHFQPQRPRPHLHDHQGQGGHIDVLAVNAGITHRDVRRDYRGAFR